nr:MAG TPA: hypothetical protein [Caudoviricetes sp.]
MPGLQRHSTAQHCYRRPGKRSATRQQSQISLPHQCL